MPEREKDHGIAIGLIGVVVIAAVFVGWIASVGYRREHVSEREQASLSQAEQGGEKIAVDCVGIGTSEQQCSVLMPSANADEAAKYDLRAQQEMAEWALAMFMATVGGLIVSSVGLWALFVNLGLQRKATGHAFEAARAAQQQVRAMDESNRPFVFIEPDPSPTYYDWFDRREDFRWPFRLTNYGRSPAVLRSVRYGLALEEELPPIDWPAIMPWLNDVPDDSPRHMSRHRLDMRPCEFPGGQHVLMSEQSWSMEQPPSHPAVFIPGTANRIWNAIRDALQDGPNPRIYWFLVVQVEYQSPTGEPYVTHMAARADGRGAAVAVDEIGGAAYNRRT